jgi:hypothetical protein
MMKNAAILICMLVMFAGPACADEDEIRSGRQLGHPEFLTCKATTDCTIIVTSTCGLQMAVNAQYAAAADAAAAQSVKCVRRMQSNPNARPFCSFGECSMLVPSDPIVEDEK